MENWIEIISFALPQDAYLVKGRLESEGIEIILKDELTTQVYNFYSNAIGGVKLLVKESDYEKAHEILVESKYISTEVRKPNKFLMKIDKLTGKLPLIGKSILELRLFVIVTVLLLIIIVPVTLLSLPSTYDKLTKNYCRAEKIYIDGKEFGQVKSALVFDDGNSNFSGLIEFRQDGVILISCLDSVPIFNDWRLKNDSIYITESRTSNYITPKSKLNTLFVGKYKVEIDENYFKMKSSRITIIGSLN